LLREGRLGSWSAELVDELANLLALVEAGIDFVDQDDVTPIAPGALAARVQAIVRRVDELLTHSRSWGAIEALPRVVLVGAPNTGKSTLFNALLGRERAVISPVRGTTRDVLTEPLTLAMDNGVRREVMLVDIAGLDAPIDALDEQVQAAARRAIAAADLLLYVNDGRSDLASYPLPPGQSWMRVRTKMDAMEPLSAGLPADESICKSPEGYEISVSALTGQGLHDLRLALASRLGDRAVSVAGQMLVLQPRHEAAIRSAGDRLRQATALLNGQIFDRLGNAELIAGVLREALDDLACIGGVVSADDLIGRVFAAFCIGK
jgi:tRNA modification GTPase